MSNCFILCHKIEGTVHCCKQMQYTWLISVAKQFTSVFPPKGEDTLLPKHLENNSFWFPVDVHTQRSLILKPLFNAKTKRKPLVFIPFCLKY